MKKSQIKNPQFAFVPQSGTMADNHACGATRSEFTTPMAWTCPASGGIRNRQCIVLCLVFALFFGPAFTQEEETVPVSMSLNFKFKGADLNIVLADYSEKTGRTLLRAPNLPPINITLQNEGELTLDEYLMAIDTVLGMHGITLLKVGDKFLKVVPTAQARQEAMDIRESVDLAPIEETGELVSCMISLKYIDTAEAKKAVEPFKHAYGQIHIFELINSILVTDDAANVNRITQILAHIDQPIEAREEPHVIQIRFAKAADIKKKLEEIIAESQKEAQKSMVPRQKESGAPGVVAPPAPKAPPGVIRAPRPPKPEKTEEEEIITEMIEAAERGIIRGKVKIIEDARTNILIIITRPENMKFFEKIVKILDVETEPDVMVKIFRLEYANAETVGSTLNTLIGSTDKTKEGVPLPKSEGAAEAKSAALSEYIAQAGKGGAAEKEKSKIGELSATNIKILSDKRTNSLLIMASKADLVTIEEIIKNMDMMLPQVLIEAVIIQVSLDDTVSSGMHWVQRAIMGYSVNADGTKKAIGAVAGSAGSGAGDLMPAMQDPMSLTSLGSWGAGSGLAAYFTHFGLNLDAVVKLVATDTRTHILSAPVIVTTDNTKAIVTSSDQKYFLKGSTVDQFGNVRPETEIKDIGLNLEVTPHINVKRNVMMEIVQNVSDQGTDQAIEGQGKWPTTKKRSFTASIAVQDRETIVLGGLVRNYKEKIRTKVPILGDIPLLGRLFSYNSDTDARGEVVVFVTPYVLSSPDEIEEEAVRRKESLSIGGLWQKGWSDSKLAEGTEEDQPQATEKHFLQSQEEKRWEETFKEIDRRVEKEIQ